MGMTQNDTGSANLGAEIPGVRITQGERLEIR